MSIFEGEDEAASQQGRVSELGAAVPHDLKLDPFRRGIAAVLDGSGTRVGTLVTDVTVWWRTEGLLRKRNVDPREVVEAQLVFDPVELDEDGYPVEKPWLDNVFEKDDPVIDALLAGTLPYPGGDLALQWFQGGDAAREHADKRDCPPRELTAGDRADQNHQDREHEDGEHRLGPQPGEDPQERHG